MVSIMRLRFPWFPWFLWFPLALCGFHDFHGFYAVSMVSIMRLRFPWFPWILYMFSVVLAVSMVSIGFVRFPWFPWFLWFLCGVHGFYDASPVSMLSMACVVSMRFGWFAVSMFSIVCLRFLWFPWSVYFLCGFSGFYGIFMFFPSFSRIPWFLSTSASFTLAIFHGTSLSCSTRSGTLRLSGTCIFLGYCGYYLKECSSRRCQQPKKHVPFWI